MPLVTVMILTGVSVLFQALSFPAIASDSAECHLLSYFGQSILETRTAQTVSSDNRYRAKSCGNATLGCKTGLNPKT